MTVAPLWPCELGRPRRNTFARERKLKRVPCCGGDPIEMNSKLSQVGTDARRRSAMIQAVPGTYGHVHEYQASYPSYAPEYQNR